MLENLHAILWSWPGVVVGTVHSVLWGNGPPWNASGWDVALVVETAPCTRIIVPPGWDPWEFLLWRVCSWQAQCWEGKSRRFYRVRDGCDWDHLSIKYMDWTSPCPDAFSGQCFSKEMTLTWIWGLVPCGRKMGPRSQECTSESNRTVKMRNDLT